MALKTVLVHLTDSESAPHLLATALEIARPAKGHVIGLVVLPPVFIIPAGTPGLADPVIIDSQHEQAKALAVALRPILDAIVAQSDCTGEILVADGGDSITGQALLDHAITCDLIVVKRSQMGWSRLETADAPDSVALGCGRPVLVLPDQKHTPVARRVLVAWDGSREAARALFDAIPLLQSAEAVRIDWIAPEDDPYLAFGLQPTDVVAMLGRHGISSEARSVQRPRGLAGQTLLLSADEYRADLLIMGCYGHSRLLEFVLGGVSRHVLENATIPVLLSH